MRTIGIIPARYASSRLPGKPLLRETGKYLLEHVYEQACRAKRLDVVLVATDDERIAKAAEGFGARTVMTSPDCPSGTDRVAEAVQLLPEVLGEGIEPDMVVNIQGDEPEIPPENLDILVRTLEESDAPVATLAVRSRDPLDYQNPGVVKVVLDREGRALYFSRSPLPYFRDEAGRLGDHFLKHIGTYAYRKAFLIRLASLPPTRLERAERLEQLRILEHGSRIALAIVERDSMGIDTPDDYARFVQKYRREAHP